MAESAVPILPSRDLRETLTFYERLGFENRGAPPEEWGLPDHRPRRDRAAFLRRPQNRPLTTAAGCYLRVLDADAVHDEWKTIGVDPDSATGSRLEAPMDTDYGMREFALVDRSGNLVRVGSPIAGR
jgi:hypothetical protein